METMLSGNLKSSDATQKFDWYLVVFSKEADFSYNNCYLVSKPNNCSNTTAMPLIVVCYFSCQKFCPNIHIGKQGRIIKLRNPRLCRNF